MAHAPSLQQFETLFQLMAAFPDEQTAIDHFTAIRWADGAYCALCGSTKVYHFSDKRTHKCGDCRKRFSIKVGTIFEDTKIELRKWIMAIWLITSHKKGIASTTLARDPGITQKSAWHMLRRLRHAARTQSFNKPLDGEVEIDETYVGGKASNRTRATRRTAPARRARSLSSELWSAAVTSSRPWSKAPAPPPSTASLPRLSHRARRSRPTNTPATVTLPHVRPWRRPSQRWRVCPRRRPHQ
jgi:transposase-like protein